MKKKHLNWCKQQVLVNWTVGYPITSISSFAAYNNISKYKARHIYQELIDKCIIEKYNNKFYLLSTDFSDDAMSVQKRLITKARYFI